MQRDLDESKAGQKYFVHEWVSFHARHTPAHSAVNQDTTTVSYAELDILSAQVAQFLILKKIRLNDPIVVIMERSPQLIAIMLGIFKAGGIFVPINPKYPDEKIRFIIDDCQTHLILTDNLRRVPEDSLFRTVLISPNMAEIKPIEPMMSPPCVHDENAIAYVIYTSGTTGTPKGVKILHTSLMNLFKFYKNNLQITQNDRASQFATQGFDSFFCETIPFLSIGASVHIIDDHTRLTPALFFLWLVKHKITVCDLPTSYFRVLYTYDWPDTPTLRIVKIGGEALPCWPDKIFTFDLWNAYGPTETTIEATFVCLAKAGQKSEDLKRLHATPPIGKPPENVFCYIVDKDMNQVPTGTSGELLIGGAGLSPGYLNRLDLTQKKFIENPFNSQLNSLLYRTGDLVRLHEDGNIEYIGRIDNQVKIRGYRIELGEIESCISGYPDVSEVVVLAREKTNGEKSLTAWLVPKIEKIRIPWQGKCLITIDSGQYYQAIIEDISREGIAISGLTEALTEKMPIRINLVLPGSNDSIWLEGVCVWYKNSRSGIHLNQTSLQKNLLEKCIEYYLSTHNLMETLESAAIKRNLKNALKSKLPEYMIPENFCIMPRLPLTFNGKIDVNALPLPVQRGLSPNDHPIEAATETQKLLARIWEGILNRKYISMSDNFFDIGGNSLLVSELCIKIMETFGITLPANIFFDRPYIPIIAEYIESRGENYTDSSPVQKQIQKDIILSADINPGRISSMSPDEPRNILLTGSGGFLGIYLLKYLLAQTDAKIFCLIRKSGFQNIASKFMDQVNRFSLTNEISLNNRRIILISGDISLNQFNLPLEQYNNISKQIDCIYHCGAQVNTMSSYTSLRESNVIGTQEVIRFATHIKDKAIYYISTLSSANKKDINGCFAEDFPDSNHSELNGGYALTKWVSEKLLTQVMQRGLPVHIYRAGYIMGDSIYGVTNTNDALLMLIKGCIQMGAAPNWTDKIAVLPVDFVSHAIVSMSRYLPSKSDVYHIDNPKGFPWVNLVRKISSMGYPIRIISHADWLGELSNIPHNNALFSFIPYYLSMKMAPMTPPTGMQKTIKVLEKIGLPWPNTDERLLNIYFNHLIQVGFLPEPATEGFYQSDK